MLSELSLYPDIVLVTYHPSHSWPIPLMGVSSLVAGVEYSNSILAIEENFIRGHIADRKSPGSMCLYSSTRAICGEKMTHWAVKYPILQDDVLITW